MSCHGAFMQISALFCWKNQVSTAGETASHAFFRQLRTTSPRISSGSSSRSGRDACKASIGTRSWELLSQKPTDLQHVVFGQKVF